MTGWRPKAEQLWPRHNIFSPVFAALPSHPNLLLPPLKVTREPVSSPQFSKQLTDTSVTLQHAREVFWDTKTVFPDRKYSVYLPFWFIHSDETLRTPPKGKEWMAASFHCPLSQPAAGHLDIATTGQLAHGANASLVPPAGFAADASPLAAVEVCKHRPSLSLSLEGGPKHIQSSFIPCPPFIHPLYRA